MGPRINWDVSFHAQIDYMRAADDYIILSSDQLEEAVRVTHLMIAHDPESFRLAVDVVHHEEPIEIAPMTSAAFYHPPHSRMLRPFGAGKGDQLRLRVKNVSGAPILFDALFFCEPISRGPNL